MTPTAFEESVKLVGDPLDRVDGDAKVTGTARYAAEFAFDRMSHGCIVQSTVARGRIVRMDTAEAERAPGVLVVLTPRNAPRLVRAGAPDGPSRGGGAEAHGAGGGAGNSPDPFAKPYVLQDDRVRNFGQCIAVVVAESFEQARDAAQLVRATYETETPAVVMEPLLDQAYVPEKLLNPDLKPETRRGDFERDWERGEVRMDATYTTPHEHHNPMEPHAAIALWPAPQHLMVCDATQNVNGTQRNLAALFGLKPAQVRVVAPFIGGGFGCKGPTWEHTIAAAMAARVVGRPVRLVLSRREMFEAVGYRPHTRQRLRLAAGRDGRLTAVGQAIFTPTNRTEQYVEPSGRGTPMLYASPSLLVTHRAVRLDLPRGTIMRAPGECSGSFPLECAMDELAAALKLDPIELRRRNEPPRDPQEDLPWSSRSLLECFRQGAARFGWEHRPPGARATRDGRHWIGSGVATATYPATRRPCSAHVRLTPDNRVVVQLAATDLGTGTYTALTQIAAEVLGLRPELIKVDIGDTDYPPTPGSGGSFGLSSYGTAVRNACRAVQAKVLEMARGDAGWPLAGLGPDEVVGRNAGLAAGADASRRATYAEVIRRHAPKEGVAAAADAKPPEKKEYSTHAFGAQFAEVRVDGDSGETRVTRYVGAFACGRIINAKTARSQLAGGIVMGIGMALMEESVVDARYGNFINSDLAEYHVPVNRDIPEIDVLLVEERDDRVNPLGIKGLGEIGIVGAAAAVANAVYHATGIRVRDLPITPDKLLV